MNQFIQYSSDMRNYDGIILLNCIFFLMPIPLDKRKICSSEHDCLARMKDCFRCLLEDHGKHRNDQLFMIIVKLGVQVYLTTICQFIEFLVSDP
jgi:hypothetical protein